MTIEGITIEETGRIRDVSLGTDIASVQTRYDSTVVEQLRDSSAIAISGAEKDILRGLAGEVAELAYQPLEATKRSLWYDHNALQATRPLVFCDPENGWNEIFPADQLLCRGQLGRRWEMHLRKEVFWGTQMGDDYTIQPFFNICHIHDGGYEEWGLKETVIGGDDGGSYRWDAPLKTDDDFAKLQFPSVHIDTKATERLLSLAEEILGDLLTVRLQTNWWWSLGMTMRVAFLRGLQQLMFDMMDSPDFLHQIMAFMRDGTLAFLDKLERENLLSLNNDGTYVGSGGLGWSRELPAADFDGSVRPIDMWGFAESQETVGISPQMFAEFVFPYQLPILERFGLNCYGCCEPLDSRWHVVEQIPRLRRVSLSPWSDVAKMAERLGDRYILSIKPSPAVLSEYSIDDEKIRTELRSMFAATRQCCVEVIMKDNHTIGNNPQNVIRWCEIARQEAERF